MEALGIRSMCREWKLTVEGQTSTLYADASAALSIATRQGAGKMRHVYVKSLALQEKEVQKELIYEKTKGGENPSVRQELDERYARVVNLRPSKD